MKKTVGFAWAAAAVAVVSLGSCTSTTRLASSGAVDDLYASHDIEAIRKTEARREEARARLEQQRAEAWERWLAELRAEAEAEAGDAYPEDILSYSYEDSYERRLRGFESPSYKMPGSYYDYYYGDKYFETQMYDPAFYNVIVMGDQVWVEPRYITSMFGHWGTPVNINIGWGWNRWYRPYWDWYYTPSWGWSDPYWGWGGYNPYYWHYPGYWGWGGHSHWGSGYWGGGWGRRDGRPASTASSSTRRPGSTLGSVGSSVPGRYNNSGLTGGASSSGTSYRRGTSSTLGGAVRSSGITYRRGTTSSGGVSIPSGRSSGTTYRRGSSSSSAPARSSSPSYNSPSRSSGGSYGGGSSSSGSSGGGSRGGSSSRGSSGGGRR